MSLPERRQWQLTTDDTPHGSHGQITAGTRLYHIYCPHCSGPILLVHSICCKWRKYLIDRDCCRHWLVKQLLLLCSRMSGEEYRVRSELAALRKEASGISISKEFAKSARLQRKINALSDRLKSESEYSFCHVVSESHLIRHRRLIEELLSHQIEVRIHSTSLCRLRKLKTLLYDQTHAECIVLFFLPDQAVTALYMSWNYRSKPILRVPAAYFEPHIPLGFIMSWPSGIAGKIFGCWYFWPNDDAPWKRACDPQSIIRSGHSLIHESIWCVSPDPTVLSSHFFTSGGIGIVPWLSIAIRAGNKLAQLFTCSRV